ncbi:hypothetical protein SDC9_99984 [bioreactor metagenome]|uniref:Uncharacterized protein n=1 Tax=bioreactor metagenome TaxID=1076179 RepID=A0A645AJ77_9ZZZZ
MYRRQRQRLSVRGLHHGHGDLFAVNELFYERLCLRLPGKLQRRAVFSDLRDDGNADCASAAVGLHDYLPVVLDVFPGKFSLVVISCGDKTARHRHSGVGEEKLRGGLIHREHTGFGARTGVGDPKGFKDGLYPAVFAPASVEGDKDAVRLITRPVFDKLAYGGDIAQLGLVAEIGHSLRDRGP